MFFIVQKFFLASVRIHKKAHVFWKYKVTMTFIGSEIGIAVSDSSHTAAVFLPLSQVCVDNVLKTMKENANKASSILLTAIPQISQMDWAQTMKTLKVSCQLFDDSFPFSKSLRRSWQRGSVYFFYLELS